MSELEVLRWQLAEKDRRIRQLEQELVEEKSDFVEFNLNFPILFNPSDKGYALLYDHGSKYSKQPRKQAYFKGWYNMAGWEAMRLFAPHFTLGTVEPINMNIRLQRKSLKSVDNSFIED